MVCEEVARATPLFRIQNIHCFVGLHLKSSAWEGSALWSLSLSQLSFSLRWLSKNLFWCQAFGTNGILPNSSVPLWHVVMLYNSDVIRWETVTHIQLTAGGGFRWLGTFSSWSVFFKHSLFLNYGPTNQGEGDQLPSGSKAQLLRDEVNENLKIPGWHLFKNQGTKVAWQHKIV